MGGAQRLISRKYIAQISCAKIGFFLEPMGQLHPNFNWRLILSIEFTTRNKLNFKGHKGQKRPGFRPLRPCRWVLFLILQMVDMVVCLLPSKRTARPQRQIHPEVGSWPYLPFMAF